MVVEDDVSILKFLRSNLKAECYAVDTADCGVEGMRLLQQHEYDLVILDNQLPGLTGCEICSQARELGIMVPVMGLSVISGAGMRVDFLNAGADDCMSKPFSLDELLARLRALLRRPKGINGDVLQVKDLRLYVREHKVTRDEEDIKLTKKEFSLLEYLMRNQGVILSRGMILEHVWDMNADPFSYTIEAHITSLRRKIGDKDQYIIRTVIGCGYQIPA